MSEQYGSVPLVGPSIRYAMGIPENEVFEMLRTEGYGDTLRGRLIHAAETAGFGLAAEKIAEGLYWAVRTVGSATRFNAGARQVDPADLEALSDPNRAALPPSSSGSTFRPAADGSWNFGRAKIERSKIDFIFGRSASSKHNLDRSLDILGHMKRLGVPDSPEAI